MPLSMESRLSPSLRPQAKDCYSSCPPSPDFDFPLHGSHSSAPVSSSSAIGDSKESDSLGSPIYESQFSSLLAAKKVSFKANSGAHASPVFDGLSISPASPIFQSDYCREVVGADQSVNIEVPCVNITPKIDYPVSLAIPNLESEQNGVECAEGVSPSAQKCSEELKSEGSSCCWAVAGSTPVDHLPVLDSTVQLMYAGAELMPFDGLSTLHMDSPRLLKDCHQVGLLPVSKEVHMECHTDDSHKRKIQLLPQRSEFDFPRIKSGSGLSTEHAGDPSGIT